MFDGRNYNWRFEEALDNLTGKVLDRDEALGQLVGVEFVLWEAVRGAMIATGNIVALLFVAPLSYLLSRTENASWTTGAMLVAIWLTITIGLYLLFKFTVYVEIARHVKGRRFGRLDLPWLPRSPNYNPIKYSHDPNASVFED